MTARTHAGKVGSPDQTRGTGRPNKLLIKDYAETRGGTFRVETDVELTAPEFKQLQGWLDDPSASTKTIVAFLHKKVDDQDKSGKENAKKMFSAAFDLTA